MKKLIALLLATVMLLSMAACQSRDKKDKTDKPTKATEDTQNTTDDTQDTQAPETTEPTTEAPEDNPDTTEPTTEAPEATEPAEPFIPELGEGVYSKTSYTVSDDDLLTNKDQVIATVGEAGLTVSELQVYYWMNVISFLNQYSYQLEFLGFDIGSPLDEQSAVDDRSTWQQLLLQQSLDSWHQYQAMALVAAAENTPISEDLLIELENLDENMEASAAESGYDTVDAMLQAELGPGITMDAYRSYLTVYINGLGYYDYHSNNIEITDSMIDSYYTEHEADLVAADAGKDAGKLVDVRHILFQPQGGTTAADNSVTYSDAEWEACKQEAQAVLDLWLEGGQTEELFAALATEHTSDPGSQTTGGLYEDVATGDMVTEFDAWCFDESRKVGDYGLVKTTYGYHVMYYSGDEAIWISQCREALLSEKLGALIDAACEAYPLEVQYENLMLGHSSLMG